MTDDLLLTFHSSSAASPFMLHGKLSAQEPEINLYVAMDMAMLEQAACMK